MMIEKTDRMERVLKQVVKVLASNTNYATLITGPTYHHNKVKFIQLSKLNEEQLLAVIVVEGNLVKNQIVNLDETIDDEQILKLNLLLNTQLNGLTIEEISLGMITKLKEQAGVHSGVVSTVLDAVQMPLQWTMRKFRCIHPYILPSIAASFVALDLKLRHGPVAVVVDLQSQTLDFREGQHLPQEYLLKAAVGVIGQIVEGAVLLGVGGILFAEHGQDIFLPHLLGQLHHRLCLLV